MFFADSTLTLPSPCPRSWDQLCPVTRTAERFSNLYPAGEGAGYAGGIMSSALDGADSAFAILATC